MRHAIILGTIWLFGGGCGQPLEIPLVDGGAGQRDAPNSAPLDAAASADVGGSFNDAGVAGDASAAFDAAGADLQVTDGPGGDGQPDGGDGGVGDGQPTEGGPDGLADGSSAGDSTTPSDAGGTTGDGP